MSIKVTSKGGDKFARALEERKARLQKNLPSALMNCGLMVERTAVNDYLSGPRPDKLDRVTGELAASVNTQPETPYKVTIGTNKEYAPPHEFGSSRLPPRPFLRPALDDNRGNILNQIVKVLRGN